ncbi:MAG: response regulator [Pseudomonadota bacterium]
MPEPGDAPMAKARILAVEDSATQREELRFLLEDAGYSVATAMDGLHGLEVARAQAFDLVITDVVMPRMDGYALCRALRAEPPLAHLPVILLTSLGDPRDVMLGLEAGADYYIGKPFDAKALLAAVRHVLANRDLDDGDPAATGVQFAGQRYHITAPRRRILGLLLSTYESAVLRNAELQQARDALRELNEDLETRVFERTAALAAEVVARRASEEKLRVVTSSALDGVVLADGAGRVAYWNPAAERLFGYSEAEILGHEVGDLLVPTEPDGAHQERFAGFWRSGTGGAAGQVVEVTGQHRDGHDFPAEVSLASIRMEDGYWASAIIRDASARKAAETERLRLEEQLRVSQKMEAVGLLAGGVAHDFNNLLAVIMGYVELTLDRLPCDDPCVHDLEEVQRAAERAAGLTRQLLAFSRKQVLQPVPLDLNKVSAGVEKMLRRILGEDIEFSQRPAPSLRLVRADPGQVEQVLLNLVVNARDAMPGGGRLTIETANVDVDETWAAAGVDLAPGPYVLLSVSDTGCGMSSEVRARIFEPFFTTKERGRGTGLGLSTVYGIVTQSGGNLAVYSEPGLGSCFKVYLPQDPSAEEEVAMPQHETERPRGTETILLVEDEGALREVARRILTESGYTVLLAADGEAGLEASWRHAAPIHLLLTDVVMPRMGGRALAERLCEQRPEMRVLFISGYVDSAIARQGAIDPGAPFLGKPFSALELMRAVRRVLDGPYSPP